MAGFNKFKSFFIEEDSSDLTYEELMMQELKGNNEMNYTPEGPGDSYDESEDIEIEIVDVSSIEEIYAKAGIADLSNSVYKVEEIKSVLPSTLSNSAKKESVLGMMQVSKIDPEEVLKDAAQRIIVLNKALDSFTVETVNVIENNTAEIAELEERINALKEEINQRQVSQEKQDKIVNDESAKIDSVIKFIS